MKPHGKDAPDAAAPVAVKLAFAKSQDLKEKVEIVVDDIASTNENVKEKIDEGATSVDAHDTLKDGEAIEGKVQECAGDLHEVTDTLARGIEDLRKIEIALGESQKALADTKVVLAHAREEEREASLRALHDSTTGMPNRDLFDQRLAHAIALADRHDWTLAVMFLDLDRFKSINDTHGHAGGDVVLKEVATRLMQHCRAEDTVCRNGGDEFLYLLMNPPGRDIERISRVVLERIALPIHVGGRQLVINASIGIALYPEDGTVGEQLIKDADAAMYRAKHRKSGCEFFKPIVR